ncbi:MAG: cupin domain-containing protein [Gammaproteobacteria bacterium]|nr:cupin domain-containing protein [Gammaproteobacteria bacterium]
MIPDSIGEKHYHSFVSEYCVCLKGQLRIKLDKETIHSLNSGDTINIPARIPHQLINPGKQICRYMVIQSGGAYDFKTMSPV